jgi:U3 small nucleolar RNA-associated protein 12
MVKAYLRYEFSGSFGVITSNAFPLYDLSGKLLITASLENVSIWNIKQNTLVGR